ncbi:MAG: hypothetical protein ABI579_09260, partial [Candidatus Sumerlaeota bacterium]
CTNSGKEPVRDGLVPEKLRTNLRRRSDAILRRAFIFREGVNQFRDILLVAGAGRIDSEFKWGFTLSRGHGFLALRI